MFFNVLDTNFLLKTSMGKAYQGYKNLFSLTLPLLQVDFQRIKMRQHL